jgi:signal transduction histidine kinase
MTTTATIEELQAALAARDKVIATLLERASDAQARPESAFTLLERNLALEHAVARRTAEVEARGAQLEAAMTELQAAQATLLHSHKLLAIGQLAAGIAHEINTPAQYVSDNTTFLETAFAKLLKVIEACKAAIGPDAPPGAAEAARAALKASRFDYLAREVPRAIAQSLEGLERIRTIVVAMKEFSHPSTGAKAPTPLNDAIATTITVARNEWKYVAELVTDFDPAVAEVPCLRDELGQAVLNLIVNAAHAIGEVTQEGKLGLGTIRVTTRRDGDHVEIAVADTGAGIKPEHRARMFEPFFTTKPVGKGTGQGLAIVYSVVRDKHGGEIRFDSEVGKGTTFTIRLPAPLAGGAA